MVKKLLGREEPAPAVSVPIKHAAVPKNSDIIDKKNMKNTAVTPVAAQPVAKVKDQSTNEKSARVATKRI